MSGRLIEVAGGVEDRREGGRPESAAGLAEQSWHATPEVDGGERWRRAALAAEYHLQSGDFERFASLVRELLPLAASGDQRSHAYALSSVVASAESKEEELELLTRGSRPRAPPRPARPRGRDRDGREDGRRRGDDRRAAERVQLGCRLRNRADLECWAGRWDDASRLAAGERARVPGRRSRDRDELTEAERRVAALVAEGCSNKEVGAALFVTVKTVEAALTRTYRKLGLRSRAELARHVTEAG